MNLASWGGLGGCDTSGRYVLRDAPLRDQLGARLAIPFGEGRSYGDACLNPGGDALVTTQLDRFIAFDEATGILSCESGVTLGDIQRAFAPRGWMLAVTPGTQFVTVGGAIANDVHGKNHHRAGCFGNHVTSLTLERSDGQVINCGPDKEPDWFAATVGGLGLTGMIRAVSLKLRRVTSQWLDTELVPFESLEDFFRLSETSEQDWEYTVSWLDCSRPGSARGVFIRANHSHSNDAVAAERRKLDVPFTPPVSPVNRFSVRLFNEMYFRFQCSKAGRRLSHYQPYFYPLDAVLHWNRMYGRRGFFQYQLVVPYTDGGGAIAAVIEAIGRSGRASFLSVLKTFGRIQSPGMLSFPREGVTLALDFPNRGAETERLFRELDAIVGPAGGRLYPAKDARMPREVFEAGYPEAAAFTQYRDPAISSGLSRRLLGS